MSPTTTLYRPVGSRELERIAESGYRRFPQRLPHQTIFYPVLNESYATQIARDWNVKASGVGIVTRFQIDKAYIDQFEIHQVGGRTILEYWIPAERLEEFNDHIVGLIAAVTRFEVVDGDVVELRLT